MLYQNRQGPKSLAYSASTNIQQHLSVEELKTQYRLAFNSIEDAIFLSK